MDSRKDTTRRKWKLNVADPESIASMGGRKFAFTDENPAGIYTVTLPAQTSVPTTAPGKAVQVDISLTLG